MNVQDSKDAASLRLMAVVLLSSLLMLAWFYFRPLSALVVSTFVLLCAIVAIWPPQIRIGNAQHKPRS